MLFISGFSDSTPTKIIWFPCFANSSASFAYLAGGHILSLEVSANPGANAITLFVIFSFFMMLVTVSLSVVETSSGRSSLMVTLVSIARTRSAKVSEQCCMSL